MSGIDWSTLNIVNSLDDVKALARLHGVCQYRVTNLKNSTKYSFKCSEYRKFSLCRYELKAIVTDDIQNSITVMSKNLHVHENRNLTSRLPSPIRESVSKYVNAGLSQPQIRSLLEREHPSISVSPVKLISLVQTNRRKNHPKIFSVYDFRAWCDGHKDGSVPHSTFVPFYYINDINDLFVLFTTKQLIQQLQYSPLLQIDATYKVTWNELPLLIFGTSDNNRKFRPFGAALVSTDEGSSCYEHLFASLQSISIQELHQPYLPKFIMADGAPGITSAQQKLFPHAKRLMCWFHMIQKCRAHRNLMSKKQWNEIDKEIHTIQLSFSDEVFNHGMNLLMAKWRSDPTLIKFCDYFHKQWIETLIYWYEGSALNIPSTNNGCESINATVKRQYTLRNKLHLSSFLPKIESMLNDWSKHCENNSFSVSASITHECELAAYHWAIGIDHNNIHHWYNNFYVVPSSNAKMANSAWLNMYLSREWLTFDDFLVWQQSCWIVVPLESCTCPVGMKVYSCKHSVGLAIKFNLYQVSDQTRTQPLGKRKAKGRPKKVSTALSYK